MQKKFKIFLVFLPVFTLVFSCFLGVDKQVNAATLSVYPPSGTFAVGSTFDVSVFINTEDQSVNAVQTSLSFPPDKLQLVSPSTGKSVIGVWTSQPSINNQTGKIDLQGGVPGGINVGNGLVTTLTFRVKSVGAATLRFLDESKVLMHDGKGSDVLNNTTSGIYNLVLPPPAGPVVVSQTHPDQTLWYSSRSLSLAWNSDEKVSGFSYELSQDPTSVPDNTQDSDKDSVMYRELPDGIHYFHIKALSGGVWGGVTHFAVKIDSSSPADFPIKVIPSARTVRKQPIIEFQTTDKHSGISHYELKFINLKESGEQLLFVEFTSPYVPQELSVGEYLVAVRVHDNAGNMREVTQKVEIIGSAFQIVGSEGLYLGEKIIIRWLWVWLFICVILAGLIWLAVRVKRSHLEIDRLRKNKKLPENLNNQLEELKRYKEKFGTLLILIFFVTSMALVFTKPVYAADSLSTPTLTLLSEQLSNKEIFYVGGRVEIPETEVVIYLQNSETQETYTFNTKSNKIGEWFYRHEAFLPSGRYVVWVQGKLQQAQSAPSGQKEVFVKSQAFQLAGSRLSYELVYLILLLLTIGSFILLVLYTLYHSKQVSRKKKLLQEEVRQAEESVKRGFAVLRRDIEQELKALKNSGGKMTKKEREKEAQLTSDLAEVESRLYKEIWQIGESE